MSIAITPETKVGALLDAYPGIEDELIAWVPAFSKLKNPVLRKTVAKVATLEQAARIGGLNVADLLRKIRAATGQPETPARPPSSNGTSSCGNAHGASAVPLPDTRPDWVREDCVRHVLDADSMLETGEHPIGRIRLYSTNLEPGAIIRLTSSFRPAPLIDTMQRSGMLVWSEEQSPGRHVTYFTRRPF